MLKFIDTYVHCILREEYKDLVKDAITSATNETKSISRVYDDYWAQWIYIERNPNWKGRVESMSVGCSNWNKIVTPFGYISIDKVQYIGQLLTVLHELYQGLKFDTRVEANKNVKYVQI